MGIVMFLLALGIVVAGLTFYFEEHLGFIQNPNQSVSGEIAGDVREVMLKRNPAGHYVATGMINSSPVVFMLDTGATNVSIPKPVADRIGLTPGTRMRAITANGTIEVRSTRLDTVELGVIKLRDVQGSINPGMGGEQILLGMAFLRDLELVQRGDTLLLRQLSD